MVFKIISISLLIVIFAFTSGCASRDIKPMNNLVNPVWPTPPANGRIAFELAFSTPQELGIEKSFWQWLGDIVFGADEARMVRPTAVVTVGDQLIYVADPGVRGVHRFNTLTHSYQLIRGNNGLEFPSPVALATDAEGNVYITDSRLAGVFVIYNGEDKALKLELNTTLKQPTGLAIDADTGDLYLLDTAQHQVLIFSHSGQLKKRFGKRGIKPAEFNFPTHIWVNNGILLVTDSLNFRIQLFDLDGNYLSSFGKAGQSSGSQSRPKGIAMDQSGAIFIVDALLNNIQLFDSKGQFLMTIGERGQKPGQFWLPNGIYISPLEKIYVADSYNRRVQVFRYIGKEL